MFGFAELVVDDVDVEVQFADVLEFGLPDLQFDDPNRLNPKLKNTRSRSSRSPAVILYWRPTNAKPATSLWQESRLKKVEVLPVFEKLCARSDSCVASVVGNCWERSRLEGVVGS